MQSIPKDSGDRLCCRHCYFLISSRSQNLGIGGQQKMVCMGALFLLQLIRWTMHKYWRFMSCMIIIKVRCIKLISGNNGFLQIWSKH